MHFINRALSSASKFKRCVWLVNQTCKGGRYCEGVRWKLVHIVFEIASVYLGSVLVFNHEIDRWCVSPLKHLVKRILAVMAETLEDTFSIEDFERRQWTHCIINKILINTSTDKKYHHGLKEHQIFSKIPKFRCEML